MGRILPSLCAALVCAPIASSGLAEDRSYSSLDPDRLVEMRSKFQNEGGVVLSCLFDTICFETECGSATANAELWTQTTWEGESENTNASFTGLWLGPDDRADVKGGIVGSQLVGIIAGMGTGIGLVSISLQDGKSAYTVHGRTDTRVTTFLGQCEETEKT